MKILNKYITRIYFVVDYLFLNLIFLNIKLTPFHPSALSVYFLVCFRFCKNRQKGVFVALGM